MRPRSVAVAGAWTVLGWCGLSAGAQNLPRIHVTALGMHADHHTVAVGDTYHITIHVRIAERRDRLDELVLPTITNATELGDERHRIAGSVGTDFYDIMTLSSPQAGTASFTPAYVDAINPSTERALRYSSAPLTVTVNPAAGRHPSLLHILRLIAHAFLNALLYVGFAFAAAAVLRFVTLRRPRRRPVHAPPAPPTPPQVVRRTFAPRDPLRDAVAAVRARADDASLDVLRTLLFARAGARGGATLTDALRALGPRDPVLARAMTTAERVRFGPSAQRGAALRELFEALDALLLITPASA